MLVWFATIVVEPTHKPFRMGDGNHAVRSRKQKTVVRKIVLIKPNTTVTPLDEVVYTAQLLASCLVIEKPQMVVSTCHAQATQ